MIKNNLDVFSNELNHIEKNNTHHYVLKKLKNIKDPIILELGVDQGGSTINFLNYVNSYGGELFSIDINDCSKIIYSESFRNVSTKKWNFLTSNDVDIDNILLKFPILKKGIDILYIDSYHDISHVKKILEKWYVYIKKFGYIFFDDTESYIWRKLKNFPLCVNNDAIDKLVREFYYRNYDQLVLTKYFAGSGLSELFKSSEFGTNANFSSKVWNYNYFLGIIYIFLKKTSYFLKKKDKKKPNSSFHNE